MTTPSAAESALCLVSGCGHPQAPGIALCTKHETNLSTWVTQLGVEYERLSAVPSMQGREVGTIGRSGLASQRSVGLIDVMTMRDQRNNEHIEADPDGNHTLSVPGTLAHWARRIHAERGLTPPVTTFTASRTVLARHLNWAMNQPWAGELHDNMRRLWDQIKRANGTATPRPGWPCACGGRIRWSDGAAVCQACGTRTTGLDVVRKHAEGNVA